MKKSTKLASALALLLAGSAAQAGLVLTINVGDSDGMGGYTFTDADDVTITDGVDDAGTVMLGNSEDGDITYHSLFAGDNLNGWSLTTANAVTLADASPLIHFDAYVKSSAVGAIEVSMTDDTFTFGDLSDVTFISGFSGTISSGMTATYTVELTDSSGTVILHDFITAGGSIADIDLTTHNVDGGVDGVYTLTATVVFTSNASNLVSSIDTSVKVPVPATLALFGLGLLGLGWSRKKA